MLISTVPLMREYAPRSGVYDAKVNLKLGADLARELDVKAAKMGVSRTSMVRAAVRRFLADPDQGLVLAEADPKLAKVLRKRRAEELLHATRS